jgi:hypothetical protein
MEKETERSAEMGRVWEEHTASGLSRRDFCQERGWRGEHAVKPRKQERRPRMVAVKVDAAQPAQHLAHSPRNRRRIECS